MRGWFRSKEHSVGQKVFDACRTGDHDRLQALLKQGGVGTHMEDGCAHTPLHYAAIHGHDGCVRALLHHGFGVEPQLPDGQSALHLAAVRGHATVTTTLIDKGADVNKRTLAGNTPLHLASRNGHADVATILLQRGAHVADCNGDLNTPLHLACSSGHREVVFLLMTKGAPLVAKNIAGNYPIHLLCINGGVEIVELMLNSVVERPSQAKADPKRPTLHDLLNTPNVDGHTPLHLAAKFGRAAVVRLLLFKGAENIENKYGQLPMSLSRDTECLEILGTDMERLGLGEQAHVLQERVRSSVGVHPLLEAVQHGLSKDVARMLDCGHPPDIVDEDRWTPLHWAASKGYIQEASLLINAGARLDALTRTGKTPIQVAQDAHQIMAVEYLEEVGASLRVQESYSRKGFETETPERLEDQNPAELQVLLIEAAKRGDTAQMGDLIESGADVGIRGEDGWTPLHHAAFTGHLGALSLMVEMGGSLDQRTEKGETVVDVAQRAGHTDIVGAVAEMRAAIDVQRSIGKTWFNFKEEVVEDGKAETKGKGLRHRVARVLRTASKDVKQLEDAVRRDDTMKLGALLEAGNIDVNGEDSSGWTVLHHAAAMGNVEAISMLVDTGFRIEARTVDGYTPVDLAMKEEHTDAVYLLEEMHAALQVQGTYARQRFAGDTSWTTKTLKQKKRKEKKEDMATTADTMLLDASRTGDAAKVSKLLASGYEEGTRLNGRDTNGWTALHHAAYGGHVSVITLLVNAGAATDCRNAHGLTPLDVAVERGNDEAVETLEELTAALLVQLCTGTQRYLFGGGGFIGASSDEEEGEGVAHDRIRNFRARVVNEYRQLKHRLSDAFERKKETTKPLEGPEQQQQQHVFSLEDIIRDEDGVEYFKAYLYRMRSVEYLLFWLDVEGYKLLQLPENRRTEADLIYAKFVEKSGWSRIKISKSERAAIERGLRSEWPDPDLFNAAQEEVVKIMKKVSFVDFIKGKEFQRLVTRKEDEIKRALTLDEVLKDAIGIECFLDYVTRIEHSEENLLFWLEVDIYSRLPRCQIQAEEARRLFGEYISPETSGEKTLFIDAAMREKIEEGLDSPEPDLFFPAQAEVYNLLETTSYLNFLNSPSCSLMIRRMQARERKRDTLPNLLKDPEGIQFFAQYLFRTSTGLYDLHLWRAVSGFRLFLSKAGYISGEARALYDKFLGPDAPSRVTMNPKLLAEIEDHFQLDTPGPNLFDGVQAEVYKRLAGDYFPSFRQSAEGLTLVEIRRNRLSTLKPSSNFLRIFGRGARSSSADLAPPRKISSGGERSGRKPLSEKKERQSVVTNYAVDDSAYAPAPRGPVRRSPRPFAGTPTGGGSNSSGSGGGGGGGGRLPSPSPPSPASPPAPPSPPTPHEDSPSVKLRSVSSEDRRPPEDSTQRRQNRLSFDVPLPRRPSPPVRESLLLREDSGTIPESALAELREKDRGTVE